MPTEMMRNGILIHIQVTEFYTANTSTHATDIMNGDSHFSFWTAYVDIKLNVPVGHSEMAIKYSVVL